MAKLKLDLVCQVAVAVWDLEAGLASFRELLGIDESSLSFSRSLEAFQEERLQDVTYQGRPVESFRYRQYNFSLGGMDIEMFAPEDKEEVNPFTDFLRTHGPGIHHLNIRLANRREGIAYLEEDLGIPPFFDLSHLGRKCTYFDLRKQLGMIIEIGSRVVGPRAAMPEEQIRRLTAYGHEEETA